MSVCPCGVHAYSSVPDRSPGHFHYFSTIFLPEHPYKGQDTYHFLIDFKLINPHVNKSYQKWSKRYKNWLKDINHDQKYPPRTFIEARMFISLGQISLQDAYLGQDFC